MSSINKQITPKVAAALAKQRNYNEVIEFLDSHWVSSYSQKTFSTTKKIDALLGYPSTAVNTILIAGSNGKGLTTHFTTKLLQEEGLKVGSLYAPHTLTYNERISINEETISNKTFTELANEIINSCDTNEIDIDSAALLTFIGLLYFARNQVDVAILEVDPHGAYSPVNICHAKIVVITRITDDPATYGYQSLELLIKDTLAVVKESTWVVSADQSKFNLQTMQNITNALKGNWAMPIRKLAALPYPFGQMQGRAAAAAERAAQLYVEHIIGSRSAHLRQSLLTKPKGNRGRPPLTEKKRREMNPPRTLEQFWRETVSTLPGRFQLLEKEKPTILLDNASNIDALHNLLLGIRLLHYRRQLKGLVLVVGAHANSLKIEEFIKEIRYFFKKTSGQILLCPIKDKIPGQRNTGTWDVEVITNELKNLKIKAKATSNFAEAFEIAKQSVDDRYGLVVITGSQDIIAEYWTYKDIKKF